MITSKEILSQMKIGLKQFGEYTFFDKGPEEIMNLDPIVNALKKLSALDAGNIIKEVGDQGDHGWHLMNALVDNLDDMEDDWFEEVLFITNASY